MNLLSDFVLSPGLIEFDAWIGPKPHRLSIKGLEGEVAEITPPADPALAMTLVPAMRHGGTLRIEADLSPRILRMQPEFQALQRAWSPEWASKPELHEVAVEAGRRPAPAPAGSGRVGLFFSGGIDSWASLLSAPEVTDLIFIRGADILPNFTSLHEGLGDRVEATLRETAEELGKTLHAVELNLREFSDPLIEWSVFYNSALCAIALFFESLFDRVLIPTDIDHAFQQPLGAAHLIDGLWSSEALEIVDHGGRLGRFDRTRFVASNPVVQRTLRVCYMNYDRAYNCGRCPKCNLTLIALEALGVREKFTTFPDELDFAELEAYTPVSGIQLVLWEDLLRGVEECGRENLAAVVRPLIERGRRNLADPTLIAAQEEAAAAQAQLNEVLGSTSWRATEPLRRAGALARRVRSPRR